MKHLTALCIALLLAGTLIAQEQSRVATKPATLHQLHNNSSLQLTPVDPGTKPRTWAGDMTDNHYRAQVLNPKSNGRIYKNDLARENLNEAFADHLALAPVSELDSVSVRVIDVDNGLCTIIRLPGNKYVIYDAGGLNTANGTQTWGYMKKFLPEGSTVELMVLSHMDGDHIVAASQAIRGYHIKKVIWGGYDRKIDGSNTTETNAFKRLKAALHDRRDITESINLHERDSVIYPGGDINISGVHFKILCGFGKPLQEWHLNSDAGERLNGVSIVMKVIYGNNSVLFTGDALGRRKDDPDSTCIATEKFLVDHAGNELQSNVMFSPHHGAENGSSKPFLDKVKPEYIVIPSGHVSTFLHPRKTTCLRYLNYVTADHILRTDRGDDQGAKEWDYLRIPGSRDVAGDDDIQIDLRSDNKLHVYYLNPINVSTAHP